MSTDSMVSPRRQVLCGALVAIAGFATRKAVQSAESLADTAESVWSAGDVVASANALVGLRMYETRAWAALPDDADDDAPEVEACSMASDAVRVAGVALAGLPSRCAADLKAKATALLLLGHSDSAQFATALAEHHYLAASVLQDAARLA